MTTTNPRVHVTLSRPLDDLVTRFAAVQRTSKSDVLRELLEAAAPSLARALALMEAATRAKPEMLRGMASALEQAQSRIEGIVEGTMGAIEAQSDLVDQAQAVKARRPARAPRVSGASAAEGADSARRSRGRARSALPAPPPSKRGGK